MSRIYVTGHRNPDTDSIAAAIGYAELKGRIDPGNEYVPVRLGELNAQTEWVLERAGADAPVLLPHILLRVRDVMRGDFSTAHQTEPVRQLGLAMAREGLDVVPVIDDDGALVGVMTERALARRYIRESREASQLDAPTKISAIADVLDGELVAGEDHDIDGRVWVLASDIASLLHDMTEGDVAVVGDRIDAQKRAIELGVSLLVVTNGSEPPADVLDYARAQGTAVVRSALDSYVSGRLVTLAVPCLALMDADPFTVRRHELVDDIADEIKDIHYRAAIAVDGSGRPVGLVTRSDLVDPSPRQVILVDHAEHAQSVAGIETAEIVEILDHHHIGSIETSVPVAATFDPVGSTATLVIERFRSNGMEPSRPTACALLGAVLSDTVILNSPTTTERDRVATSYLERVLALDAGDFGRQMFEESSDVDSLTAAEVLARDGKEYEIAGGQTLRIAQIETVGEGLLERRDELMEALRTDREKSGHVLSALMVTDIVAGATELLVAGDAAPVKRAFGADLADGAMDLPGVMSRKKQVAPKLLRAASG
ncbi:MAG: putative manganese-dependent inorganic diphosphatase [Actinomycetota bacterium]|nr:putative manganese-dependent inorganic diphosphatase [Actinomycetota bacterium]